MEHSTRTPTWVQKVPRRLAKFWKDHVYSLEHDLIMLHDMHFSEAELAQTKRDFELKVIRDAADPALAAIGRVFPKQSRTFAGYLNRGVTILAAFHGTEPQGFFLAAPIPFYDDKNYRITFARGPGSFYGLNFFMNPTARKSGSGHFLIYHGFHYMRTQGYTQFFATVKTRMPELMLHYRGMKMYESGQAVDVRKCCHITWSKIVPARMDLGSGTQDCGAPQR